MATRLSIAVLAVAIGGLVASVVVSSETIESDADQLLETRVRTRADTASSEVNSFISTVSANVRSMAATPSVVEATSAFVDAYRELDTIDVATLTTEQTSVSVFYLDEFIPALADVRGQSIDILDTAPRSTGAPIYLQAKYITESPLLPDERSLLTDALDGSTWTEVHRTWHPIMRQIARGLEFEDLFLVDARTGNVVYSVNKDIAFATNLLDGPHSATPLAAAVRNTLTAPEQGSVIGADIAIYPPRLDRPSGFLTAPVFEGDEVVGVLAVGVPVDAVTEILTTDWREGRFGDTGEIYLVGSDLRMRTDSRFFLESPRAYLDTIDVIGSVAEIDRRRMEQLGTTALFQEVDTEAVRSGLAGERGITRTTSYLGREVFSAYAPISGSAVDWVLIVDAERDEVHEPFGDYIREVLIVVIVFVVILTFVAAAWANSFVNPLRTMSATLRSIRDGSDAARVPEAGAQEFRVLAGHLNGMVDGLWQRKEAVMRALSGKAAVLRTLLPDSAVERVQVGDRRLVQSFPQASVVVLRLGGLDELFSEGDVASNREFLHAVVDLTDGVAARQGLERLKIAGDTYVAACGLGTPHLDHAPRTAAFAADAILAINDLAAQRGVTLTVSSGIASGSVTAGLVGDTRLVFDLWGDPVDDADRLARAAAPNQILVTDRTRNRLPAGEDLTEVPIGPDAAAWALPTLDPATEPSR